MAVGSLLEPAWRLDPAVRRWLESLTGASLASIQRLPTFRPAGAARAACRVDLTDGRVVKLRRTARAADAARVARLVAAASASAIARVLGVRDRWIIEEWIDGTPLDAARDPPANFAAAGALLAELHGIESVAGRLVRSNGSTAGARQRFHDDLAAVRRAGGMDAGTEEAVRAAAARCDPRVTAFGVAHGDFAPENLVRRVDGTLAAIDNEDVHIGPLDGDLVRAIVRWPIDAAARAHFLSGYFAAGRRPPADADTRFWTFGSLARSARVRTGAGDRAVAASCVAALADLAGVAPVPLVVGAPRAGRPPATGAAVESGDSARPRLDLRYGSLVVTVTADRGATIAWLREFLSPSFSAVPVADAAGIACVGVDFHVDADWCARVEQETAGAEVAVDGFTFDSRFSRLSLWTAGDGTRWLYDADARTCYGSARAGHVRVVAREERSYDRVAFMRVVRELAGAANLGDGHLPVHAAAFADGDGVVLVCGPKRSGKTSLLLHALASGAKLVANDRVFLDTVAPRVAAMPTIVALRDGTLDLFPEIRRRFEAARYDRGRTLAECAPGVPRPAPTMGPAMERPGVSLPQLAALTGAALVPGGRLRAVVFGRVDTSARGVLFVRLDEHAAARLLAASLVRPSSPIRGSAAFTINGRRETLPLDVETALCQAVTARVSAYTCVIGPGAFDLPLSGAPL